eukprot:TRINITY_DN26251_c0_g1_i2.p2 TRINITY_DN26251_c0_g1~~TRINITY_DN26251_c0_g1_i2.p2  ORF type:complete len:501 (+),score=150.68 TRINITY_DN26251_c0_g1_i2:78-1580(+)
MTASPANAASGDAAKPTPAAGTGSDVANSTPASPDTPKAGRAGRIEFSVMECRGLDPGVDAKIIAEFGGIRETTGSHHPSGETIFDDRFSFPVENPLGYIYIKVVSGGYVSTEVIGRGSISLSDLHSSWGKRIDCWLELLPPAIGEDVALRGPRFRALNPAVYRLGLPHTMSRTAHPPMWLHISARWVDPPSLGGLYLKEWDWSEPHYPIDGLDWFGNVFIAHCNRIVTSLQLPCSLAAVRGASLPMRILAASFYVICMLYVEFWMIPSIAFAFAMANGVYFRCVVESCPSTIPLYEDDNPVDPPTILESLQECVSAPSAILKGQGFLGDIAAILERIGFLFAFSDVTSHAPAVVALFASTFASFVLYHVPFRLLAILPGMLFFLTGGGGDPPAVVPSGDDPTAPPSSGDADGSPGNTASAGSDTAQPGQDAAGAAGVPAGGAATGGPAATTLPPLLAARPSVIVTFLRNLWMFTPDREEYIHRRVCSMQKVDAGNVPNM